MAYLQAAAVPILALGAMLWACLAAGSVLLRKLTFHSRVERAVFTIAIGMGAWASAWFLLGVAGWLYRGVILILTFSVIGASLVKCLVDIWRRRSELSLSLPGWKAVTAAATLSLCIVMYFWVSLYPPTAWDSTMYHLVHAREYLVHHRIFPHEGLTYPVLPLLNHMLFAWGLALNGENVAQLVEAVFLLLVAFGIYTWCRRNNRPALGFGAAALWLSHPCVLWLGRVAYVDLGVAAFAFLGIYALWNSRAEAVSWLFCGFALLSFCAATKLNGLFFLLIATAWLVWRIIRKDFLLKSSLPALGIAAFCALPWYGFIFYHTGSPIWPFLREFSNGVWGEGGISRNFKWVFDLGVPKNIPNFLQLSLLMATQEWKFNAPDHQGLLIAIAFWPIAWLVALRERAVRWWTLWAFAYTVFWFLTTQQLRFWIAVLPMACLSLCESIRWVLQRFRRGEALSRFVWIPAGCIALFFSLEATTLVLKQRGIPPLRAVKRERYLANNLAGYRAVSYVNQHSGAGDVAYVIFGQWINYYLHPGILDHTGLLQGKHQPTYRWPDDAEWLSYLKSKNVKWIVMYPPFTEDWIRVAQTSSQEYPCWPEYPRVFVDSETWVFRYTANAACGVTDSAN